MAGVSPGRGRIHCVGSECAEAEFFGTSGDVFCNSFESFEVGDFGNIVASFVKKSVVYDDAVAFIAITDGAEFAVFIIEHISIGVEFVCDCSAGEIKAIIAPGFNVSRVFDYEDGRSFALIHFSGKRFVISTGSSGFDFYFNTGFSGVFCCKFFKYFVRFGFEVEPVNGTGCFGFAGFCGCFGIRRFFRGFAACCEGENHYESHEHCKKLFHLVFLLNFNLGFYP